VPFTGTFELYSISDTMEIGRERMFQIVADTRFIWWETAIAELGMGARFDVSLCVARTKASITVTDGCGDHGIRTDKNDNRSGQNWDCWQPCEHTEVQL